LRTFKPLFQQDAFALRRGPESKPERERNVPQKWLPNEEWEASLTTKRTVRITIDTTRLLVVLRGTSARVRCEQCATEVDMVPVESAAELVQVDAQTFQHLLAREDFHRSKPDGPVRICLNSLLKSIQLKSLEAGFDSSSELPAGKDRR
jgi:hypothetical protein